MARLEFSKTTKRAAWDRAAGHCENCTKPSRPGDVEYDHIIEDYFDGGNGLDNCRVLCKSCHSGKTKKNAPVIAKSRRLRDKNAGIKKRSSFRGWRKFNGDIVWKD